MEEVIYRGLAHQKKKPINNKRLYLTLLKDFNYLLDKSSFETNILLPS